MAGYQPKVDRETECTHLRTLASTLIRAPQNVSLHTFSACSFRRPFRTSEARETQQQNEAKISLKHDAAVGDVDDDDDVEEDEEGVAIVTQCSLNRLECLEELAQAWRGVISIAVYMPSRGDFASFQDGIPNPCPLPSTLFYDLFSPSCSFTLPALG